MLQESKNFRKSNCIKDNREYIHILVITIYVHANKLKESRFSLSEVEVIYL